METHGGMGKLYERLYAHLPIGIVFEKKPDKVNLLTKQRPTWAVYEGDCEAAIAAGVGAHLPVNFLDVDPYGSPWRVIEAFLMSDRPKPEQLHVVVNDGLRQSIQLTGGWKQKDVQPLVQRFGNGLYGKYLDCCQILMHEKATQAGYTLSRWAGYYTGKNQHMTHYWAVLDKV